MFLLSKADQIKAFDQFVSDNRFEEYRFNSKWGLQVAILTNGRVILGRVEKML